MDESSDDKREGEKIEPETGAASGGPTDAAGDAPKRQGSDGNLPVVWSPKLDAGEAAEEAAPEHAADAETPTDGEAANGAAVAAPPRSWRFAMLAATVALAAALGSFLGALGGYGVDRLLPGSMPAAAPNANIADATAVLRAMKSQSAELAALKASLDGATRNTTAQFATLADRLDRVEHAAAPPETTGSIPAAATPPVEAKTTDRIVQDWVVQDVRGDRALIENRNGGLFDVGAGSVLPGLGRVATVKRQDGQWVVVTDHGLITSGR